ncbi:MAG: DNA (cytosine-5-)-methyltransferase [Candidatus Thorarchaeota archaeon]
MDFLYNHICSSLSDLDLEMICSVPPGGNWQDIPETIVKKSTRLTQISNSGGRTTYYGRLSNHLPSYTINTYFNRPGNGSFIHPDENRLISMREAARLQSFPDHFRFLGSFSSRYKQIGNAVPPLLARSVAEVLETGQVIDLFSGAGGLSEGFAQAGNDVILGSDLNIHMCETYAYNHPQTRVVQADLSSDSQYAHLLEEIENVLSGRTLTCLIGGPPCQGFSTAGRWKPSDTRNSLVLAMLNLVNKLAPETVVIENVLGMKWMQKGLVFHKILDILEKFGYSCSVADLRAEEFCVPQRRRRLFVLGTRSNEFITIPRGILSPIKRGKTRKDVKPTSANLPPPVSVYEAISDLPPLTRNLGSDSVIYNPKWIKTDYQRLMRGLIDRSEFIEKRSEQG